MGGVRSDERRMKQQVDVYQHNVCFSCLYSKWERWFPSRGMPHAPATFVLCISVVGGVCIRGSTTRRMQNGFFGFGWTSSCRPNGVRVSWCRVGLGFPIMQVCPTAEIICC